MPIELGQKEKLFNLAEAREHLTLMQSITQSSQTLLTPVQDRLNRMLSNDPRRPSLEQKYESVVAKWRFKVEQLGATVNGLWVVEFDLGDVVLCWRYPELKLGFVRVHGQPFSKRVKLALYIEENDPDWV